MKADSSSDDGPVCPPRSASPPPPKGRSYVKDSLQTDKQIIVIKVGTSSLTRPEYQTLNLSTMCRLCETVKAFKLQGHHVIIVTSGAVGVGCQRLGLVNKPSQLAKKQALAAIGQLRLMRFYEDIFTALDMRCAQVLLTLENLANRNQYLNARNTFVELMAYDTVPIVNENDTVAVQELRFGDNDTLSAQVAALVQADWLFLITDVDFLYTANPKDNPDAEPIYLVEDITKLTADTRTGGTQWGTGGMATKLTAGRIATAAGCRMVICNSNNPENMVRILSGEPKMGTIFLPMQQALRGRKRWLLTVPARGELWLDSGALHAVKDRHTSLFAAGIVKVVGDFHAQDAIKLCDDTGVEFARALVNYTNDDLDKIKGMRAIEAAKTLGFNGVDEVVHRENLACLADPNNPDADEEEQKDGYMTPPPNRMPQSMDPSTLAASLAASLSMHMHMPSFSFSPPKLQP